MGDKAATKPLEEADLEMVRQVARVNQIAGPHDRLMQAWAERGYTSAEAFAKAVGVRPGTLRQQLARPGLPRDAAIRYAAFLGKSLTWLLTGKHADEPPPSLPSDAFPSVAGVGMSQPRPDPNVRVPAEQPERLVGERDLPVYGSAQGGDGGMTVDPTPIEWVKRPSPLQSVQKGFAVYVVGESMSPAFEHGDMVLVHPNLPVGRGDDALLVNVPVDGGDWVAIVKRVLGWSDKAWKLQQFNPKREFDAPRTAFPQAYRIVGKYNRR